MTFPFKLCHTLTHFATLFTLFGCVPDPVAPANGSDPLVQGGVYVLCEGLWSQDNSTLSYLSPTGNVVRDVVSVYNSGTKLGDTSTDLVVKNDTLIIAVSTSKSICMVRKSDGKWLGRLSMVSGQPYRLAMSSTGKLFCTNLNDDSITELDANSLTITVPRVAVGPAPEGIACADGKVYVAISGLGDLRKSEQGAGTVSVLSDYDLSVQTTFSDLPNVGEVCADASRHRVWVAYRHYASQPDSLGGIVEIDTRKDTIVHVWRMKVPTAIAVDSESGAVYVLNETGVVRIESNSPTPTLVAPHENKNGNDIWYSLGFDPIRKLIVVGNARSYVTDGEVILFRTDGTIEARLNVGINPTAFAF